MRNIVARYLKKDIIRFCLVGGIGFMVNLVSLYITVGKLEMNITVAQLISAETALLSNFFWHNNWTYSSYPNHKHLGIWTKLAKFHLSSWSGLALNVLIVVICFRYFDLSYAMGLIVASLSVLAWNYLWTKYVIFGSRHYGSSVPPVL